MSKWIDKLEKGTSTDVGGSELVQLHQQYIYYSSRRPEKVQLNGEFTIEQLQDLIDHMKKYGGQ